jgi:hypothetical protein
MYDQLVAAEAGDREPATVSRRALSPTGTVSLRGLLREVMIATFP